MIRNTIGFGGGFPSPGPDERPRTHGNNTSRVHMPFQSQTEQFGVSFKNMNQVKIKFDAEKHRRDRYLVNKTISNNSFTRNEFLDEI